MMLFFLFIILLSLVVFILFLIFMVNLVIFLFFRGFIVCFSEIEFGVGVCLLFVSRMSVLVM